MNPEEQKAEAPQPAWKDRHFHKNIWLARLAFQSDIKSVVKDAKGQDGNRDYEYASLPSLLDYALPILSNHGLLLEQYNVEDVVYDEKTETAAGSASVTQKRVSKIRRGVKTILRHVDSEKDNTIENTLWYDKEPDTIKRLGGEITYLRRYSVQTVLDLSAEDDDAGTPGAGKKNKTAEPDPAKREQKEAPPKAPDTRLSGKPPIEKMTAAQIEAEFNEKGLNDKGIQDSLMAVGIDTMKKALAFRAKFTSNEAMLAQLNGGAA